MNLNSKEFDLENSSTAFEIGYGYRFNRYFELGATVTVNMENKITSEFIDYAVDLNNQTEALIVTEQNTQYQNSIKSTFFTGLHLKASYPITRNLDLFGQIGATYANLQKVEYYNVVNEDGTFDFIDNVPYGVTPEEILTGISNGYKPCKLTGDESICDFGIKSDKSSINEVSASYGVGIRWMFFDSWGTQIVNVGYKSLVDLDDLKADSFYVNYEFVF